MEFIIKTESENSIFKKNGFPELVRCKDCKYAIPSSENVILCTAPIESQYPKAYKPIDWFCAGGAQKDGDRNAEN